VSALITRGHSAKPCWSWSINLRIAKTLGLDVPLTLQASPDEVIE
jgi:hypothetical protein